MSFSKGGKGERKIETTVGVYSETDIAKIYFGVKRLPCSMLSPLRREKHPSFSFYRTSSGHIRYKDFVTGENGSIIELVCKLLDTSYDHLPFRLASSLTLGCRLKEIKVLKNYEDMDTHDETTLQCRVRKWAKRDTDYWGEYGIPLKWLKWAEVYPISNIIFQNSKGRYVFGADPLAYVFVEHKDDKTTLKVYQPKNREGRKWLNKNDKSVIGLWTKVPERAPLLCIASSLKDALSLSVGTGIPAIYLQGEGYGISKTALKSLKERYERVCILFDNDAPGLKHGKRLSEETGFENIILPEFEGGKDISDYRKIVGEEKFKETMLSLFEVKP